MKVLQLCHRIPFPANDGGNIAIISVADALLAQGVHVKMLTLNTRKHHVDLNSFPGDIKSKYGIESIPIDTDVNIPGAFKNLFSDQSYNVMRFHSREFEEKLLQVLNTDNYDIVLMESLFMTPYIPIIRKNSRARIVMRAHNVEHTIWERLAKNEKNILRRTYLSLLARRLKKYEMQIINQVDAILPITGDDEQVFRKLGCTVPMNVTPVGIDAGKYSSQIMPEEQLCIFHLGAMDWRPNLEGIEWFLDDCWDMIHKKFPSLKLYLAGRGFPDWLMNRAGSGVTCAGEIMDAIEFMDGKQLMIVPLKSGGGMRVKIIQGMALGKTIISTTIGAEGISYTNGKNILIADSPEDILMQIEKCLDDKNLCLSIGSEARKFVLAGYSNESIGKQIIEFCNTL